MALDASFGEIELTLANEEEDAEEMGIDGDLVETETDEAASPSDRRLAAYAWAEMVSRRLRAQRIRTGGP